MVKLHCLGNNGKKKSVHVQYRGSHLRPNYVVHVSNNEMFWGSISNLELFESEDAEPTDTACILAIAKNSISYQLTQRFS